jgi:UDP-N-acetylmuramoyl-L-alanyl-D-glutamate--2,6-diaminopimelate ligase
MHTLKKFVRLRIPESLLLRYHQIRAFCAALWYGFPGKKLIIVGVTGTKGKTSVGNYAWSVLTSGGFKTGLISSAIFRIGTESIPNAYHMTMPDPFVIQKILARMRKEKVEIAVVEMTSEGMKQYRNTCIPADVAIFTNLTPEHLPSHNNDFETYKRAKSPLFASLAHPHKTLRGKEVHTAIIANADSEHAPYYLSFPADERYTYGFSYGDTRAEAITTSANGSMFRVGNYLYELSIPGEFNIYNALPAIITGRLFGLSEETIAQGLKALSVIPGRMEYIEAGQPFKVVVDYAHEPASLGALLDAARMIVGPTKKVLLLSGGQGGGRDPGKRKPMARVAQEKADLLMITNEDPYDDDPKAIVEELARYAEEAGMRRGENLLVEMDRRTAIATLLARANEGDIVLCAGKGAEQTMMTKDGAIPWDERAIVREELAKRYPAH